MKELDREDKVLAYLIAQILTQLLDIFTLMATSYRSQASDCSLCLLWFISVWKQGLFTGCGERLCWHAENADGPIRHGHHEAQQGACRLGLLASRDPRLLVARMCLTAHLLWVSPVRSAQSQTLFDAACSPPSPTPSLLPGRGHAPAPSCRERPLGRCPAAAAALWYSGWSQYGGQSA